MCHLPSGNALDFPVALYLFACGESPFGLGALLTNCQLVPSLGAVLNVISSICLAPFKGCEL